MRVNSLMDAAVKLQAFNQLIPNAMRCALAQGKGGKVSYFLLSQCGRCKLITNIRSLFPLGLEPPPSPHSVVSEPSDRLDKQIGWSWIMRSAPLRPRGQPAKPTHKQT